MTLEAALDRLRALTDAGARLRVALPAGVPDNAAAALRLSEGIPALTGEPLLSPDDFVKHVRVLGASIGGSAVSEVERLLREVGAAPLCEGSLAGTWEDVDDPGAILLLDAAARPALQAGVAALGSVLQTTSWAHGYCPACGTLPALAELRGDKEGRTRILRCARCTAAWSFARLGCPACGERNHDQLRYIHAEGENHRRAECCRRCGFYVKAVARLDALGVAELLTADLETLPLDALALEAGYSR
jgi:hypothetical protein